MSTKWTTQKAIEFALRLEENEATMGENAAMLVTLEEYELEWGDQCGILAMLPDDWTTNLDQPKVSGKAENRK